jgi:hypothetical protein
MNHVNLNSFLAQDPYTLEVFADYLEENTTTIRDRSFHRFLRTRQHEERGFCDSCRRQPLNGDGHGDGYGYGDGCGSGYGDGYGGSCGDGYPYGNGSGDSYINDRGHCDGSGDE